VIEAGQKLGVPNLKINWLLLSVAATRPTSCFPAVDVVSTRRRQLL
jgi:hypothetical protein